jgi:hypothetical protein
MTGLRSLFGPRLLELLKRTPIQIPASLLLRGQKIVDWRCCLLRRMSPWLAGPKSKMQFNGVGGLRTYISFGTFFAAASGAPRAVSPI